MSGFPYSEYDVHWWELKNAFLAFIQLVKISPHILKAKPSETALHYSSFFFSPRAKLISSYVLEELP